MDILKREAHSQIELATILNVQQRTIRDYLKQLADNNIIIPYVYSYNNKKKIYYLDKPPVIERPIHTTETERRLQELLKIKASDVYTLSKELNKSIGIIRSTLIKLAIPYVTVYFNRRLYYLGEPPQIKTILTMSQNTILENLNIPKTSAELSKLTGIGIKAIRESIKKIKEPKIYQHKIQNIVYYCLSDFEPDKLELEKDVKKKELLDILKKQHLTIRELQKKLSLSDNVVYNKISKLNQLGNDIKSIKVNHERYFYIGKQPVIKIDLPITQKKIIQALSKKKHSLLELANKLSVGIKSIGENIRVLKSKGYKIDVTKSGNSVYYSYNLKEKSKSKDVEKIDELEQAARATYLIPESSLENPFVISTSNNDYFKLGFANTVYGGARTDKTLFRNFLSYCKKDNCDAIILNGNLIWMDLMMYSKNKPDRARISARNIDPSFITYPDTVKKFRDPEELLSNGETVYITFKERLDMIIKNDLSPLFIKDDKILYDKPIYILFGGMEDELRRQHTNLINRVRSRKEIEFVKQKILDLKLKLQDTPSDKKLEMQLNDWVEYKARIMMGNIDEISTQKVSRAMQGYIIEKLEQAIPNSKVISIGEGYVKANNTEIMVLYDARKTSDSISERLIDYAVGRIQSNLGSGKDKVPDIVITGGLSPYYASKAISYPTKNGDRIITAIQLPTCLEENELRKLVRTSVSAKDVLSKLGNNIKLATGAMVVENHNGINKRKLLNYDFLINNDFDNLEQKQGNIFYELNVSDEHVGSKFVKVIETKQDWLYFTEAYQRMMYETQMPIVRINNLGDEIHGLNYETWKEKHPEFMDTQVLMKYIQNNPDDIKKIIKLNSIRTGVLLPPDQVNTYVAIQNIPFLKQVIARAQQFKHYGGILNFTEGNHSQNTEGYTISTQEIQKELRYKLGVGSEITADIYGMSGIREATFGLVNDINKPKDEIESTNYLYAEYNRHVSPGNKLCSYASRLLDIRLKRGRTFKEHEGRMLISRFGHLHAGLEAFGNNNLIISCYCGQERTDYGEVRDYPIAVHGVKIVGYPKEGLRTGPLVFIDIFSENLQNYFSNGIKPMIAPLFE